jgi:PAS domain S-box-containing protein
MEHNLHIAFFKIDEKGIIVDCNDDAEKITNYPKSTLIGSPYFEMIYGIAEQDDSPFFNSLYKEKKPVEEELMITKITGESVIVSCITIPFYDDKGKLTGGVGILKNVREAKQVASKFSFILQKPVRYEVSADFNEDANKL